MNFVWASDTNFHVFFSFFEEFYIEIATNEVIISIHYVKHNYASMNLMRTTKSLSFGIWNSKFSRMRGQQFPKLEESISSRFFETKGHLKFYAIEKLIQCSQMFLFSILFFCSSSGEKNHINTSGSMFYLWCHFPLTDVVLM